jgi:hypothetical protein
MRGRMRHIAAADHSPVLQYILYFAAAEVTLSGKYLCVSSQRWDPPLLRVVVYLVFTRCARCSTREIGSRCVLGECGLGWLDLQLMMAILRWALPSLLEASYSCSVTVCPPRTGLAVLIPFISHDIVGLG